MLGALLSALHVLALGIGLGAVFARGRGLRGVAAGRMELVKTVLFADALWGIAAGLWLLTGLLRAFGGVEKSTGFYLFNVFFWIKMALFAAVFALEVVPMTTFLGWRSAIKRGAPPDTRTISKLIRVNDAETAIVVIIPFVAAAMARGLWLIP